VRKSLNRNREGGKRRADVARNSMAGGVKEQEEWGSELFPRIGRKNKRPDGEQKAD